MSNNPQADAAIQATEKMGTENCTNALIAHIKEYGVPVHETLRTHLRRIETELARYQWQPVSNAPKERTLVWGCRENKLTPGKFTTAAIWTDSKDFKTCDFWTHLPPLPESKFV